MSDCTTHDAFHGMSTPFLVFVVNVNETTRRCNQEVAVRVKPVDLLLSAITSDHQRSTHTNRVCGKRFHKGLNLHCQFAIGNNHQYDIICKDLVGIILDVIEQCQRDIIQLKKDEWKHIGKCLSASRVALQNCISITQDARNLS